MTKKNFFSFCVAAALLLGIGAANAETTINLWTSGKTTVVLTDDGVLSVSGTGAMADYSFDEVPPWYASRDAIKTLVINEEVTSIGNDAFGECSGLTGALTIPNSVTSIGDYAFYRCSGLTGALTIPNNVKSIGMAAFLNCSGLTSVTIPNNVTSIGDGAFGSCGLTGALTIPNSVTSIGMAAFSDCSDLTAINVDVANAQYSSVDGVVYNKNKTALVFYPGGKQGAFTIPNGVTSIGEAAFVFCSGLTSVTIPNSVTSIEGRAFAECSSLTSVTCFAAALPILDNYNFSSLYVAYVDTLYVPESALNTYKNNSDWSSAFDIILAIESATSIKTVDADKLHVYPNPTADVVYVDNAAGAEIKVYNLNGALLHRTRESRVNLSGEPSGVYLLRVGGETLKVVKK